MSHENQKQQPPPDRRFTDGAESCETVIGADVAIRGEVRGTSNMEFSGSLQGDLELEGFLWLRPGGRIEGTLTVTNVLVEGEVAGNINATGKVELRSSCRVLGDVAARSLAIADGGFFEGKITMAGAPSDRAAVTFQEKRQASE
jgi:cytoskeletal protein CcmA (bactofilin family)